MRTGVRLTARVLDVRQLESPAGFVRAAIVVPKFGFAAVRRNLLKRRLRELVRTRVLVQSGSYDVLVRARREAYHAEFVTLGEDVDQVAEQLASASR